MNGEQSMDDMDAVHHYANGNHQHRQQFKKKRPLEYGNPKFGYSDSQLVFDQNDFGTASTNNAQHLKENYTHGNSSVIIPKQQNSVHFLPEQLNTRNGHKNHFNGKQQQQYPFRHPCADKVKGILDETQMVERKSFFSFKKCILGNLLFFF